MQNWVKNGNWGSEMDPIVKVGHKGRVRAIVKLGMQNPEFHNRAHHFLLLKSDLILKGRAQKFLPQCLKKKIQFPDLVCDT